jgi:hypothetical protein
VDKARQARAISSFCPRKNIREASKNSRSRFDEENKEKKIVDANRSNSQVKSCFLQKKTNNILFGAVTSKTASRGH